MSIVQKMHNIVNENPGITEVDLVSKLLTMGESHTAIGEVFSEFRNTVTSVGYVLPNTNLVQYVMFPNDTMFIVHPDSIMKNFRIQEDECAY